jgi:hypothetical protein
MGKKDGTHDAPEDARKLIELIISEIQSPVDMQDLLERLPPTTNCGKELSQFLKAKDRAQRREGFIKNEPLWHRKYGWFMARIVMLFGLIVIAIAIAAGRGGADFIIAAVMGAAGYYALLTTLSGIRYRDKNRKRARLLDQEALAYQRQIASVAASLMKRFRIDPRNYPVSSPRGKSGLQETEEGCFIDLG